MKPLALHEAPAAVVFWAGVIGWTVGEAALIRRTGAGGIASRDATTLALTATVMIGIGLAIVAGSEATGLVMPGPGWWPVAAGALILAAGFALRVWSVRTLGRFFKFRVVVQEGHEVVQSGPYALVRHPSYTGMVLCSAGIGLMLGNWLALALAALPTLIGFTVRLLQEERVLAAELGEPYREYMSRTKRLVPGVW
jgi:protein-S-isoprenylcysteine O-methyltransferase Ste14